MLPRTEWNAEPYVFAQQSSQITSSIQESDVATDQLQEGASQWELAQQRWLLSGNQRSSTTNHRDGDAGRGPQNQRYHQPVPNSARQHSNQTTVARLAREKPVGDRKMTMPSRGPSKLAPTTTSKATRNLWPRIHPANDPLQRAVEETKERETKWMQHLRTRPEGDDLYANVGLFLWPQDTPAEAMGPEAAALDHLRSEYKCQIFFDEEEMIILVVSVELVTVRDVLERIKMLFAGRARQTTQYTALYLIDTPSDGPFLTGARVRPVDVTSAKAQPRIAGLGQSNPGREGKVGRFIWLDTIGVPPEQHAVLQRIEKSNNLATQVAVSKTLQKLVLHRGHIRMRVVIGALVFNKNRWPLGAPYQAADVFVESLRREDTEASFYRL